MIIFLKGGTFDRGKQLKNRIFLSTIVLSIEMTDLSLCTKEQLIEMLKQKESGDCTQNSLTDVEDPCHYKPIRAGQSQCTDNSANAWGYCKKHSRTVQAQKARDKWETQKIESYPSIDAKLNEVENNILEKEEDKVVEDKKQKAPSAQKPRRQKVIKPNVWGRYEDTETHIVFNPSDSCAYGVQNPTGEVFGLSQKHIAICEKNGWGYKNSELSDSDEIETSEEEEDDEEEEESEEEDDEDDDESGEDDDENDDE
uniref:Uncharacterized protein n=1 Tax=Marseillevirus LCMAC102 TaxID=2506603 RepID=A0A481YUQ8_9VIRU|nr:MAG: hypothetical protein LCMAC102_03100 [Marseillevirus LCMAC102]